MVKCMNMFFVLDSRSFGIYENIFSVISRCYNFTFNPAPICNILFELILNLLLGEYKALNSKPMQSVILYAVCNCKKLLNVLFIGDFNWSENINFEDLLL